MAIITYKTFLMRKNTSTWEKVLDITSFPDLGGAPEMLDTTTLSDSMKTSEPGILSGGTLEFGANYTLADYKKLKALEGKDEEYGVWFGGTETAGTLTPKGDDGKFKFKGKLTVTPPNGGSVNEVVKMKISIAPSTPITLDTTV